MGDFFQVIVDVEATEEAAGVLAGSVLQWLIDEGIVEDALTDCVLEEDMGHAAGRHFYSAVSDPDEDLRRLQINGMSVIVGRTPYDPGQDGISDIECPFCGRRYSLEKVRSGEMTERWFAFWDAIDSWRAGGAGQYPCDSCGRAVGLNDWRWTGPPWAFGSIGFKFWNWPPLSDTFVAEMSWRLGHQVVVVGGKF